MNPDLFHAELWTLQALIKGKFEPQINYYVIVTDIDKIMR